MSLKRTTIVFVSAAALAAWFAAAMSPARPALPPADTTRSPIDARGDALASEIARLRARLRPESVPRPAARNPFRFRDAPVAPAVSPLTTEPPPVLPPAEPEPALRLVGIAEDPGPDGITRTAVISGGGELFLAKENDIVSERGVSFKVGQIFAEGVDLTDLRDGSTLRLNLK